MTIQIENTVSNGTLFMSPMRFKPGKHNFTFVKKIVKLPCERHHTIDMTVKKVLTI